MVGGKLLLVLGLWAFVALAWVVERGLGLEDAVALPPAERIAVGKKPRPEADFATGLWWAALVNLLERLCLNDMDHDRERTVSGLESPRHGAMTSTTMELGRIP